MNNEEKIIQMLDLLSGLKVGQDNLITRLDGVDGHLDKIGKRLNGLEQGQNILVRQVNTLTEDVQEIHQSQVRMENELTEKLQVLSDDWEVQKNVNERIIATLNRIENKVDLLKTASLRREKE